MLVDRKPVTKINYQGKTFLPVNVGQKYEIRIDNGTNEDLLAQPKEHFCPHPNR